MMPSHGERAVIALVDNEVFQENLAGKSFLHAGCDSPDLTLKAAGLGANATGCTLDKQILALGRSQAEQSAAEVRFERLDLERDRLAEQFDVVLCRNYLQHARNPLGVLEKLIEATRECLVVQLELRKPVLFSRDRSLISAGLLRRLPAVYLAPWKRKHGMDQSFYVSETAAVAVLKTLRQDFARVDVHFSGTAHPVIVARKRRIGHLHILAGVNAIGKSTLLDHMRTGNRPEIADEMGLDLKQSWYFTTYAHLLRKSEVEFPHLVAQYNITAPLVHGALHGNHHGLQDLIQSADTVDVTTMWLSPEEQRQRYFKDRVPDAMFSPDLYKRRKIAKRRDVHGRDNETSPDGFLRGLFYMRSSYTRRKADRLLQIYAERQTYLDMYDNWFDFLEHLPVTARVLYQQPDYHCKTVDEWRKSELSD